MPLRPECLNNRIRNRFPTPLTLGTIPMRMTINTPSIPILLYKRRVAIKRIATLGTEKVTSMPLGTTSNNDLAFNRRLAALAAGRKQLVEIEVAVEAGRFVCAVVVLEARHGVCGGVRGQVRDVGAGEAGADARDAFGVFVGGFWVEGYTFEVLAALVAGEAFRVEARARGGDDAAGDGEGALGAESAGADGGWGPVGARGGCAVVAVRLVLGVWNWQWSC